MFPSKTSEDKDQPCGSRWLSPKENSVKQAYPACEMAAAGRVLREEEERRGIQAENHLFAVAIVFLAGKRGKLPRDEKKDGWEIESASVV